MLKVFAAVLFMASLKAVSAPLAFAGKDSPGPTPVDCPMTVALSPDAALARLKDEDAEPEEGELAALERVLAAAAASEPGNARWHFGVGLAAKRRAESATDQSGRLEAGRAYFASMNRAATIDPTSADYASELGTATLYSISPSEGMMAMISRAREARKHWERATAIDPNHVRALASLGFYEIEARRNGGVLFGSYRDAAKYGERLLRIDGGEFEGRMLLAQIAAEQGDWAAMERHFVEAERLAQPSKSRTRRVLHAHAAALLNNRKDAKAALGVIDRLLTASPDSFSAYFLRGSARKMLGDCAGAVEDFRAVLERNPAAMNTRYLIAECCELLGDTRAAREHYEEFARRFPQDKRAGAATKSAKRLRKAAGS